MNRDPWSHEQLRFDRKLDGFLSVEREPIPNETVVAIICVVLMFILVLLP